MFGLPLKYIGLILAALSIVATAYFAVQHYNAVVAQNVQLQGDLKAAQAERDRLQQSYGAIVSTLNQNDAQTAQIVTRTNTIERTIQAAPVTTDCVNIPSIKIAIDSLNKSQP